MKFFFIHQRVAFTFIIAICFFLPRVHAQKVQPIQNDTPFVLGTVHMIQSKILAEKRILNIYLPAGYKANDTTRYPVIYLLDGSADEDFIHIAGLVQYLNFPWIHILPKSILVGIANVDRKRDFTFPTTVQKDKKDYPTTGGSENFISFIQKELQPYIDSAYPTNATRTIIGQSLGGLLATEILFKAPGMFTNYIIISPSLWWDNESLLSKEPSVQAPAFKQQTHVFIGVGNEEKVMVNDSRRLMAILKNCRKQNLHLCFQFFAKENHATVLHRAVYAAFEKIY